MMMLKRFVTLCVPNGSSLLTTGTTSSATKVIFRTLSDQQDIDVEKWDLLSAVCLERHPVITKPMLDIEARYQKLLRQLEFENSKLSDFDIQKETKAKKEKADSTSKTASAGQTVQDLEDSWQEELRNFKFAPRIDAKEDDTVVSLNRKLDKHLVLLVEQKVGNSDFWLPPQGVRKHRETMIQTAYRTLQESCGNNVKVKFYGNAPIGFYQYKYPKHVRENGRNGAKIFYFLAKYINGDISPDVKHCWLDRDELKKLVHPNIHNSLSKFLLPD